MGTAIDNLVIKLAWSPEAREAAIAARREHAHGRLQPMLRAQRFHDAFEGSMQGSPYKGFVNHYSPDEIRHMKGILQSKDGKAGALVHDHGDGRVEMTALYNQSGTKGMGGKLIERMKNRYGVNYAEAFGEKLPEIYAHHGFKVVQSYPFVESQAPKDWDYAKFDHPNYNIMKLDEGKKEPVKLSAEKPRSMAEVKEAAKSKDPKWEAQYGDNHWGAAMAIYGPWDDGDDRSSEGTDDEISDSSV